jgi:hypothetical protein
MNILSPRHLNLWPSDLKSGGRMRNPKRKPDVARAHRKSDDHCTLLALMGQRVARTTEEWENILSNPHDGE